MTRRTMLTATFIAVAALLLGPGAGTARADSHGKDELAKGEWEGDIAYRDKPPGSGTGTAPAQPGPTSGPSGGGTPTDPTGGSGGGSGGTTTPPPGENTGTPSGGTPETDPPTPPDADDHDLDDDDVPPVVPGGAGAPETGDPGGGGGGGGNPPPATQPTSCSGKWVITEDRPDPSLTIKQTLWTLLLYRTDVFAFICGACPGIGSCTPN